jgi:hypothetical protein
MLTKWRNQQNIRFPFWVLYILHTKRYGFDYTYSVYFIDVAMILIVKQEGYNDFLF